jgi:signal transduction histidine kinase
VDVEAELCLDLPVEVRVAYYRIAQEALNNMAKHSGATHASVRLVCSEHLDLIVEDDGAGFDPAAGSSGQLGMGIMRERADSIGARLRVDSAPGKGTRVFVSWLTPLDQP